MTTNRAFEIRSGYSHTLGANYDGEGVNFAIFSAHAERVELCLYDPSGEHEIARLELPEYTDEIWHGYVPNLQPGALYGYRVYGPYDPENGHRFNPNKLLIDPYARELVGDIHWNDAHFAYQLLHDDKDLTFDDQDSAPFTPKCRVIDPAEANWEDRQRPSIPWSNAIIYETHVKGFTQLNSAIPEPLRGTFEGMGHKACVDYIKSLGITSVELLPVHWFPDDQHLLDKGLKNFWGYNSLGFFAPATRYYGPKGIQGFRDMVRAFHDAGVEVILDVVYNHTAEGNELGPTLSFKGIPWSSVNFITAHDGFTLNDLVSYNDKHNEANGEDNNDGHNDNRSCNYGAEGPTDDEGINAIRERQKRNFLTTLLFSHGTPMLLAGDEFGRSQMGNNNGYCQDSEISWVHWDNLPETANALREFTRHLIQLRAAQPLLRRESWRDGLEIRWFNAGGGPQQSEQWDEGSTIGVCISRHDLQPEAGIWHDALLLFNPFEGSVPFRIPMWGEGGWVLELTTADEAQQGMRITEEMDFDLDLAGRSIVLFRRP
ncbi:hypothetical protein HT847_000994 [Salmonella enterica]|nr:hypothetical protein [Salmonella enterica]